MSMRKKAMTGAWFVSTLKRLCEWSGHGGTSGGRASATFMSSNAGGVGGRRHSGSGGVGDRVDRCDICTDQGIRLLGLTKIDLLSKERELLRIGWNIVRDMFDSCVFPISFVRIKLI